MSDDMSQENESTIKDDEIQSEVKKKQFYSINLTAERVFLIFVLLVAIIAVIVVAFVFSTSSKTVTKNKDVASEEVIDEIVSNDDFAFFDDENAMELLDGEEDAVPVPEKVTITENKENAAEATKEAANSENTANVATEGNVTQEETVAAKPEVKIEDKISYSSNYAEKEEKAVFEVANIIKKLNMIECTKCRYCVDGCPQSIQIPDILALLNSKRVYNDWTSFRLYNEHISSNSKASDCIECGQCENICPQGLRIIDLLKEASKTFEK